MQPRWEVAHVLGRLGDGIEDLSLNGWQLRTLRAIQHCRTSVMGGHIDACDACGHKREEWIQAREADLLPVPYFHVVFTLPSELNPLALHQPKTVYDALFAAAWQTLETFGMNQGLQMGMIAVLHTWGQNLSLHPHLHCIVPGGGVNKKGNWQNLRADGKFLFPVKALGKVFRAKYVKILGEKLELEKPLRKSLFEKNWIVYAKRPFGSPKSVVEYLGRYTHKIAISNHRIQQVADECVRFSYKDYRQNGLKKSMTLSHQEFTRRFAQHILPKRFVRIRHYGFLSSTWKRVKFKKLREHFKLQPAESSCPKTLLRRCRCCGEGNLVTIEVFGPRGPPASYIGVGQTQSTHKG